MKNIKNNDSETRKEELNGISEHDWMFIRRWRTKRKIEIEQTIKKVIMKKFPQFSNEKSFPLAVASLL